ncbi:MAG: PEP-CTERM sorting domain-containing protein [Planctomycetes bacterium]|nr:PEP-CTERM sorting domain-containing protein [Planctomycetota bacterium]
MVGLGDLSGGAFSSFANGGVSADGSVIVGGGSTTSGSEAFIWDEGNGMRNLQVVLEELGLNLTGWQLSEAQGLSDDGTVITGFGINPSGFREAWVAQIPEPATLMFLALGGVAVLRKRA